MGLDIMNWLILINCKLKLNVDQTATCIAKTNLKEKNCVVNFRNGSLFISFRKFSYTKYFIQTVIKPLPNLT